MYISAWICRWAYNSICTKQNPSWRKKKYEAGCRLKLVKLFFSKEAFQVGKLPSILVSLFNGISYMLFNAKAILFEQQLRHYLINGRIDERFHLFSKCITPKVNVVGRLDFEIANFEVVVQHFSHSARAISILFIWRFIWWNFRAVNSNLAFCHQWFPHDVLFQCLGYWGNY